MLHKALEALVTLIAAPQIMIALMSVPIAFVSKYFFAAFDLTIEVHSKFIFIKSLQFLLMIMLGLATPVFMTSESKI